MVLLRIPLFLFLCFLTNFNARAFTVIFDLDYTLFLPVSKKSPGAIRASDNKYYKIHDWAVEGIQELRSQGFTISVFSGGEHERNVSLLKQVQVDKTTNLFELIDYVHSRNDLIKIGNEGSFSQRFQKSLQSLGYDLKQTVLIDDFPDLISAKEHSSLIWTGNTYHHYESFQDARKALAISEVNFDYIPKTFDQWFLAKNKLKFIFELLLDAKDRSPHQILTYIQNNRNQYIPYDHVITPEVLNIYGSVSQKPNKCFRVYSLFMAK